MKSLSNKNYQAYQHLRNADSLSKELVDEYISRVHVKIDEVEMELNLDI